MTAEQILFLITSAIILAGALMVVATRKLMHAALWLVVVLFGVAVFYAILQASFLAVVQVVVYIGAIAILFIFTDMLTRRENRDHGPQIHKHWWLPALMAIMILGGLVYIIVDLPNAEHTPVALADGFDGVRSLGMALVTPDSFLFPFEAASVLLLAALVGAVYIAVSGEKKGGQK
jgi:NADH-quinone oxidoreductase subunit J